MPNELLKLSSLADSHPDTCFLEECDCHAIFRLRFDLVQWLNDIHQREVRIGWYKIPPRKHPKAESTAIGWDDLMEDCYSLVKNVFGRRLVDPSNLAASSELVLGMAKNYDWPWYDLFSLS